MVLSSSDLFFYGFISCNDTISNEEKPPRRFLAGADAVDTAEKVAVTLQQQTAAYRELSSSLSYDDKKSAA